MIADYLKLPRTIWIIALGTLINRAGAVVVPFLTIYLTDKLQLSAQFATSAMGLFGAGSICGSLIGGQLADRFGRRPVMLAALFGSAVMLLVLSQLTQWQAILAAIFLLSLIADSYRPAVQAMIADTTLPHERGTAFSLNYLAINLGFSLGPLVAGPLIAYSYSLLFYLDAATAAANAVIAMLLLPETLRFRGQGTPPQAEGARVETAVERVSFGQAYARILRDGVFLGVCAATLLMWLVFLQFNSTLPLYLKSMGFQPDAYGRIIAVNGIMIVLLQVPLVRAVSRMDRGVVLALGATAVAIGFASHHFARLEGHFMLCVVIWTLGEMMGAAVSPPLVSDMAPAAIRARYMGAFSMCFGGANMLAAPLGGMVLEAYGPAVLWSACAVFAMASAAMFLLVRSRLPKRAVAPATT